MIDQAQLAGFLDEADDFLRSHLPLRREESAWGVGSDEVTPFVDLTTGEELAQARAAQEWRATAFDAGFGWITGPLEYGGRGLDAEFQRAYYGLRARYQAPDDKALVLALGMVGPTVLAHGQATLREKLVRPIFRGEVIACQLFSEPGAGSDLAAVRTKAVRVDGGWLLSGQKVWSSGAHLSDVGEALARTDPDAPKHKGITAFLIDMRSEGVEIRPLKQLTGGPHFNEVFLNDVFVPDEHRLGAVNGGWTVATTTLMNERATLGAGDGQEVRRLLLRLVQTARHRGLTDDPVVRQQIAELYEEVAAASISAERAMLNIRAGREPGPELSVSKLVRSNLVRRVNDLATSVLGMDMVADGGEWGTYAWSRYLLGSRAASIAGGTDEIQRNIVAERVLGLPL